MTNYVSFLLESDAAKRKLAALFATDTLRSTDDPSTAIVSPHRSRPSRITPEKDDDARRECRCTRTPLVSRTKRIIPTTQPDQTKRDLILCIFMLVTIALFLNGCAAWSGPNGLGQRVLVMCKTSPAQQAVAQKRANQYFSQVASGRKPRPARRYVSIQTLDPNEKQRAKYAQTRAAAQQKAELKGQPLRAEWADPSNLHCIMVFDVVTHESVGTNCYVVSSLPHLGNVSTYDTFPAEFVASSAESLPE